MWNSSSIQLDMSNCGAKKTTKNPILVSKSRLKLLSGRPKRVCRTIKIHSPAENWDFSEKNLKDSQNFKKKIPVAFLSTLKFQSNLPFTSCFLSNLYIKTCSEFSNTLKIFKVKAHGSKFWVLRAKYRKRSSKKKQYSLIKYFNHYIQ